MSTHSLRKGEPRERQVVRRDFGLRDGRGRLLGAAVVLVTQEYEPSPREGCGYRLPAGTYYEARPQATRDGQDFGACQAIRHFRNPADRAAYVERYFEQAAKRARKIAERGRQG